MTKKERTTLDKYYMKKYGITYNDRQKMFKELKGCCGLCGKHESCFKRRLAIEHNHTTGKVRSLACFRCNKFIIGRHTLESATKLYQYMVRYDK